MSNLDTVAVTSNNPEFTYSNSIIISFEVLSSFFANYSVDLPNYIDVKVLQGLFNQASEDNILSANANEIEELVMWLFSRDPNCRIKIEPSKNSNAFILTQSRFQQND